MIRFHYSGQEGFTHETLIVSRLSIYDHILVRLGMGMGIIRHVEFGLTRTRSGLFAMAIHMQRKEVLHQRIRKNI